LKNKYSKKIIKIILNQKPMKKLVTIASILTFSILFGGCPASSKGDPAPAAGNNSMICDINGKSWKANKLDDSVSWKDYVNIAGFNTVDNTVIILFFERAKAVTGTKITFKSEKGVIAEADIVLRKLEADGRPDGNDDPARSGTISITKASKTDVEGTFTGITFNNKSVNGKFSMKYTKVW
jgi:hypothetical protein